MEVPGKLNKCGVGDVLGRVATRLHGHDVIAASMDHQSRCADGGEERIRCRPGDSSPRVGGPLPDWRQSARSDPSPPARVRRLRPPWMKKGNTVPVPQFCSTTSSRGATASSVQPHGQSGPAANRGPVPRSTSADSPFGIDGGERHAHRTTLGNTDERRPFASGRIHHGSDVVHAFFESWPACDPVGESGAPLVEDDHPAELGEAAENIGPVGQLPVQLHVGDEARGVDQVEGSFAKDLVGDVEVTAHGIAGDGPVHDTSVVQVKPRRVTGVLESIREVFTQVLAAC